MNAFRKQALALPEVVEQPHFGAPSFRVKGKIFAQLSADETTAILKLSPGLQIWVVATFPDAAACEAGAWGRSGWTRLQWAELPRETVSDMLISSWRTVAPARLRNLLDC